MDKPQSNESDLKSDDFSWFGWDNGKLVNKHRARSLD